MNKVAIIICNYNKSEYVLQCVESLLHQTYIESDIFVVDNASQDNSVSDLSEKYGNYITIIQNKENLGSAGGFNTGIEYCKRFSYSYFILVDNDTKFDIMAIEQLFTYMEIHKDVGMCGSQILQMNNPEYIQEMGGIVDYSKYDIKQHFRGFKFDDPAIPDEIECDYIPSCAVIVRREVIEKVGMLNPEHFVYWDDIDWCKRIKDRGYKIVSIAASRVWHNWSAKSVCKFNPYSDYYGRRNKWRFFATYIDEAKIDEYVEHSLHGFFNVMYGYKRKNAERAIEISEAGFRDFCDNRWGKRNTDDLSVNTLNVFPIEKLLSGVSNVILYAEEDDVGYALINIINYFEPSITINIVSDMVRDIGCGDDKKNKTIVIRSCSHVTNVKTNILPDVYMDRFMNCIEDDETYQYFSNSKDEYIKFREKYAKCFKSGILKIRRNVETV